MQVMTDAAKTALLDLEADQLNTLVMGLYTNPVTPDGSTVLADLDAPLDSGYLADGTQPPGFGLAYINVDGDAQIDGTPFTWTFSLSAGSFTVEGYYIRGSALDTTLWIVEPATTPFEVTAAGQTYTVEPVRVKRDIT